MKKQIKNILQRRTYWKQSRKSVGHQLVRRIKYIKFAEMAQQSGVVDFRIDRVATEYTMDFFDGGGKESPDKQYLYKYGLATYKANWYGITKENCNHFLSDYDFYNIENYLNLKFSFWFDHKLSTYYLLRPFIDSIPIHYYYVKDGIYLPIDRRFTEVGFSHTVEDVIKLIQAKPLIAKSCVGGHGEGLYKLSYVNEIYQINQSPVAESEIMQVLKSLDDYIITEYVSPHEELVRLVGADSFAVLRLTVFYDASDGPQLTSARIRLGCKKAGIRTDYDGTIYSGLTLETGKMFGSVIRTNEYLYEKCPTHPDTGLQLDNNMIPNWGDLLKLIYEISYYLPMTPQLDFDIIPTNTGFSILEINSHGQFIESYYPFRENEYNLKMYKTIDRNTN